MSDPTTGHDPERPTGRPATAGGDQPTEPIGHGQAYRPTEPLGATDPPGSAAGSAHPEPADAGAGPNGQKDPAPQARPEAGWTSPAPAPPVEEPRGVPLGTLVFGLVVVAIGLLILVSVFYDIALSASAVAIALFIGAGLVLVFGGIVAARRAGANRPDA